MGIEFHEIEGNPTPEEEAVLLAALEAMLRKERQALAPSAWKLAGRADAARGGILDVRSRLARPMWPLSARLAWKGQPHQCRHGRGDSR